MNNFKELLEGKVTHKVYIKTADKLDLFDSFESWFGNLIVGKPKKIGRAGRSYDMQLGGSNLKATEEWLKDRYDPTLSSYDLSDKISSYDIKKR